MDGSFETMALDASLSRAKTRSHGLASGSSIYVVDGEDLKTDELNLLATPLGLEAPGKVSTCPTFNNRAAFSKVLKGVRMSKERFRSSQLSNGASSL